MTGPALVLLPNLLGPWQNPGEFLPPALDQEMASLDGLIAEGPTAGRKYLCHFKTKRPPNEIPIAVFNEHTPIKEVDFYLKPIQQGQRWGYVSDAGLPCIADPGSALVFRARQLGLPVVARSGPSALFLALMLSGLPAQRFHFQGYPPVQPKECIAAVKAAEKESQRQKSVQVWIEAPYRNDAFFARLLSALEETTHLCAAWDLTLPGERVMARAVGAWCKTPLPVLNKKPAVFLLYAGDPLVK